MHISSWQATLLGTAGFGFALLAYLALCVYLRPAALRWQAPELRVWLACVVTALWAAVGLAHTRYDIFTNTGLQLFNALQLASWSAVLAVLARLQNQPRWLRSGLYVVPVVVTVGALFGSWYSTQLDADSVVASWVALLSLLQPLLGVLAIEQLYRNAASGTQPALRWLLLGIGIMLAANLYLAASVVALQRFNMTVWYALGAVYTIAALAIYKGLRAIGRDWQVGLFVSRQVVFYSTSFVLIGAYLVLISIGADYVRRAAGAWGSVAQLLFVAVLGVILLVLIFSGVMRRRLRAFFATHFFRNRYDYRVEWLRFVQTLSARALQENLYQSSIQAVCRIVDSEGGRLWTINEAGTRYLPAGDWPESDAPVPLSGLDVAAPLLDFMKRSGWVVDLAEWRRNPELYDNADVPPDLRALGDDAIVVPLLHVDSMYGLLALRRPPDRKTLHFEDRDLLKMVGRHLAAHLSQADSDRRIANSKQFEAYNRMTAFVMHDLKNLTAQLQLVVTNAAKHKRNPEFVDDAIATIDNSVTRMSRLLAALAQNARSSAVRSVSLADVARRVAQRAGARQPVPVVRVAEDFSVEADPEQLSMVLDHVVRNAQEASPDGGEITLEVDVAESVPQVRVCDRGIGMDAAFVRERLFKPFDTTKGARGMGIGAYQAREYLRSLGGDVRVESQPGVGTTFILVFPHG